MRGKLYHQKLVRDKIPEIIKANGDECETRILDEDEFAKELKKKLVEEAKELEGAPEGGVADESADILELVESIAAHYNISFEDLEKSQAEKRKKRGGFTKRLFLVWATNKPK